MIYVCCIGFASLDIVCNELNDCGWNHGVVVDPHLHACLEVSFHTVNDE